MNVKGAQRSTSGGIYLADDALQELGLGKRLIYSAIPTLLECDSHTGELWSHACIFFLITTQDLGGKMHFLSHCLHLINVSKTSTLMCCYYYY